MRVTLFESVSVNGMMGRTDGGGDFFSDFCWTGFVEEARAAGAMVWGRITHDVFRGRPQAIDQLGDVAGVVLTTRAEYAPGPGWQVAATPDEAVDALARTGAARALVVGGQTVNTAFVESGLLDEVVLLMEAVLIGHGMPLVASTDTDLRLVPVAAERVADTVVRLRFDVDRRS